MDILVMIFSIFALLGILDLILGNRLKLGEEFEKGIQLVGTLTVAMLGMLCLVPLIGK
ncbi:MAG: ethanolamine utilization protein EutH, partial [Oscillospiraceae bacterium]|nr:ethanolamine utilization protein EutH [Oscillospiraceae bacterium]